MLSLLSILWRTVFFPLWLLWKGYMGLWWAFDDVPASKVGVKPAGTAPQDASFQVVDSSAGTVKLKRPMGMLRAGFAASVLVSLVAAGVMGGLGSEGRVSPTGAVVGWGWITGLMMVSSVWMARRTAIAGRAAARSSRRRRRWLTERCAAESVAQAAGVVGVKPGSAVEGAKEAASRARVLAEKAACGAYRGCAFAAGCVREKAPVAAGRVAAAVRARGHDGAAATKA